ncbi:hypothetical protein vBPaeMUSP18_22 [Pseudomonas phage vB_PaeM_USP_18]|nr:hypothetical protein vBPaeMUSP18_22 [Pseudomonas phage vB_PaeM_USP_18]
MTTKPPAQIAGVQGIAPTPIELTPARPSIDWPRLFGLPPFQMFAVERSSKSPAYVMDWIKDWASQHESAQALFDDYCQWHRSKGYWPNETPMGEVEQV